MNLKLEQKSQEEIQQYFDNNIYLIEATIKFLEQQTPSQATPSQKQEQETIHESNIITKIRQYKQKLIEVKDTYNEGQDTYNEGQDKLYIYLSDF